MDNQGPEIKLTVVNRLKVINKHNGDSYELYCCIKYSLTSLYRDQRSNQDLDFIEQNNFFLNLIFNYLHLYVLFSNFTLIQSSMVFQSFLCTLKKEIINKYYNEEV